MVFQPLSGAVMLERHCRERIRENLGEVRIVPTRDGEEFWFVVFCLTPDEGMFDVIRNMTHLGAEEERQALRFKNLTALFHWYRDLFPDGQQLVVETINFERFREENPDAFRTYRTSNPAENDKLRYQAIRAALKARGSSFAAVSRDLDVTHTAVHNVCKGKTRSTRIEAAVADMLGMDREELFETYFGYRALEVQQ